MRQRKPKPESRQCQGCPAKNQRVRMYSGPAGTGPLLLCEKCIEMLRQMEIDAHKTPLPKMPV